MKTYKHFISLGHFCSIAIDLEYLGLRDCSSPFDWLISPWKSIEELIDNHFENFLEFETLEQHPTIHKYYKNKYNIHFFHDFDKYTSLKKQLPYIKNKYNKRIERFYKNITEPTLFIRYIADQNELKYLEKNYFNIIFKLQKYNKNNNIIFIANSSLFSNILNIYYVEKDKNDTVARRPILKNKNLYNFLLNLNYPNREKNIKNFQKKEEKKKKFFLNTTFKLKKFFKKLFFKEYIHNKIYQI